MLRPEQAADLTEPDGRAEPAGPEARGVPPPGPPANGPDPWEAYDLAILNAVLDS